MSGGVTGWDLYSILAQQSVEEQFWRSQVPMACPNDGEPLKLGPPRQPGTLYCPNGDFRYPEDWDPDLHSGM